MRQNDVTITLTPNTAAQATDRFITIGAGGPIIASENGDAYLISIDESPAGNTNARTYWELCGIREVQAQAVMAVGDIVAVGSDGKAKEAVSGTSRALGVVTKANTAADGIIEFLPYGRAAQA